MYFKFLSLHKPFLFLFLLPVYSVGVCQVFPEKHYPQGYFIYPVKAKIALVANFGELRPNHFHMGLDCRTDQTENHVVFAAADGYIAHVKIEPLGFGRAIYIAHPNGLSTLYAHLNDFYPALEKYIKEQQYKLKSWKLNIDIPPGLFQVQKGDLIAYSGTTGGSQGPHVHFEIRDTKTDKVLNPLLFGFPLPDNVPPVISRLALYDRTLSTYEQVPKLFPVRALHGEFALQPADLIVTSEKISFAISASDKRNGSASANGIFQSILYMDDMPVNAFELDSISYDETRDENAHIDYKLKESGGPFVEHLSRLPGYPSGVYKDIAGNGVIMLPDENTHRMKVEVKDAAGNRSILRFNLRRKLLTTPVLKNTDMYNIFHPGFINIFEKNDIVVIVGEKALYDSFPLQYVKQPSINLESVSEQHLVEGGSVPLRIPFTIKLKVSKFVALEELPLIIMQREWKGKREVIKPQIEGDWFVAHFKEFGNFQLLLDKVPPLISVNFTDQANLAQASKIIVNITDNNKSIKNFVGELNGNWLRFSNDKGRSFIYKFDEMCRQGKNELRIHVEDEAGNTTEKVFHFTR